MLAENITMSTPGCDRLDPVLNVNWMVISECPPLRVLSPYVASLTSPTAPPLNAVPNSRYPPATAR